MVLPADTLEQLRGGELSLNSLPPGAHLNLTLVLRVRQGVVAGAAYDMQAAVLRWHSFAAAGGELHHHYTTTGEAYTVRIAGPEYDAGWEPSGVAVGESVHFRARVHLPKATTPVRLLLTPPNMQMVNLEVLSVSSQVVDPGPIPGHRISCESRSVDLGSLQDSRDILFSQS